MQNEKCKSCFECRETVAVKVRDARGAEWRDSSVRRCANDQCWHIVDGTRQDRLLWIRNVYDYKYFGDYELNPEQLAAVYEAQRLSAALSEQTLPVRVKTLEWDEFSTTERRHFQSNTILGQFQVSYLGEFECWQLYSPQKSNSWKENFSRHPSPEAAKAAAQSDYETRIRSALVNAQADADVVERLTEALKAAAEELDRISCVPRVTETTNVHDQFERAKFFADRGATAAWTALRSSGSAEVGSASKSTGTGGGE